MHPLVFHPRSKAVRDTTYTECQSRGIPVVTNMQSRALPFDVRALADGTLVGISKSGDHVFLQDDELEILLGSPDELPPKRKAELAARFFLPNHGRNRGKERLLAARRAAKRETVDAGPSLHIIVPTLQCGHTCQYCQVSRAQTDSGFSMSLPALDAACERIWESNADVLTVEFQGGDPLLRFDLIVLAVEKLTHMNQQG
jgi:uncharacterized radical SAM superfamily Fe-S cluster-containing enzyme